MEVDDANDDGNGSYGITSSFGPSIVPFNGRPHRFNTTGYSGRTEAKQTELIISAY